MKVMVVDDEPVHVRGIIKYVHWDKLGFNKIVGMHHAKEALKQLQEEAFDLVITDINMPEINGLELIRRINLTGNQPNIMIVSGYNEFTYAQEAIGLGVRAYILKPVKPEEIEEKVGILLEKNKWEAKDGKVEAHNVIGDKEAKSLHPSIQKILLHIGKNYANDISVQEISENFGINGSYLSALFKKEVGINLSNYVQRYRVNKAMELLKNSDLRINEIAYKVGFQNPCYFSEQFKKIYDVTPSEIRKELYKY